MDATVELPTSELYAVGSYLAYWITARHGDEALGELWHAIDRPASAAEFHAAFEQTLSEPLDSMLDDVVGQAGCQRVTCVGTPTPWIDGRWTIGSPRGCDDDVIGIQTPDGGQLYRYGIVEIEQDGIYEISVSDNVALLASCGSGCGLRYSQAFVGTTNYWLAAGRYRVEVSSAGPETPVYEVQIQPAQ